MEDVAMDKNLKNVVRAAVTGAVALAAISAMAATDKTPQEKCYGIAAAGKNDCATASNSCAGSSTKDRQADAFINVPKGLCQHIAGATLTPPAKKS
jgi:uncharacterized membrane protein